MHATKFSHILVGIIYDPLCACHLSTTLLTTVLVLSLTQLKKHHTGVILLGDFNI